MNSYLLTSCYFYLFVTNVFVDLIQPRQFIEVQLASFPDQLLSSLPEDTASQLLKFLDSSALSKGALSAVADEIPFEDLDDSSIERLTKSCLAVQASSAKAENLNVTFLLYTRINPRTPYIILPTTSRLELLKNSPFEAKRKLTWITHGFRTSVDKSDWMLQAKDKVLVHEDANVILTDWRRGASPALSFYPRAAANAHIVAKMIVKLLQRLRYDLDFSRIHLIGHSLGAHIMGFVGSAFTEEYLNSQQQQLLSNNPLESIWMQARDSTSNIPLIGRITACDPALPCFGPSSNPPSVGGVQPQNHREFLPTPSYSTSSVGSSAGMYDTEYKKQVPPTSVRWNHLRADSAVQVEVMHSSPGVMGYLDPLGDFDFYPNGFERQPGCESTGKIDQTKKLKRQAHLSNLPLVGRYFKQSSSGDSNPSHNEQQQQQQKQQQVGRQHAGVSSTINRFIKPIRDFFVAYACSHHRAVEYMVSSMYYDRIPFDQRLDREYVCQMVGYRCADYASFKRGFCFTCENASLDCRSFTMSEDGFSNKQQLAVEATNVQSPKKVFSFDRMMEKWKRSQYLASYSSDFTKLNETFTIDEIKKRSLPAPNRIFHLSSAPNYQPAERNNYYFDTSKSTHNYCTHHYHLLIKYRWFRMYEDLSLSGLELTGTLTSVKYQGRGELALHRYNHQSYTLLFTHPSFLGQIESLVLLGDKLRPMLVEYVKVTYMSNLDPKIRALGSGRLCRQAEPVSWMFKGFQDKGESSAFAINQSKGGFHIKANLFTRCSDSSERELQKKEQPP